MDKPANIQDCAALVVPAAPGTITLVRHGEPALSRAVRFNAKTYGEWWALYEEGGLKAVQTPPVKVAHMAANAPVLLVSTRRRSRESMQVLALGRAYIEDEVFIEAPLPPPPFPGWMHLSPKIWGFLTRFWWWYFNYHKDGESRAQAWKRSDHAAAMLIARAASGDAVVLVAHGFFNVMIEKSLIHAGWKRTLHEGGFRYWSIRHFEKL